MPSSLDQLKAIGTTVVCDSGDLSVIGKHRPQDATTNPSLILAAAKKLECQELVDRAIEYGKQCSNPSDQVGDAVDNLLVQVGKDILDIIPGRVSTEIDATLSFDKDGSIDKAVHIIKLYKEQGIDKSRVLIKLAATWEGIQAARELQSTHGINCNLTLVFSHVQAIAAAEAGAFLISPFVGRILDWHKCQTKQEYTKLNDPGVESVRQIFEYYKRYDYKTIVMGASFRNVGQITQLAGCDYLTIGPSLLEQLSTSDEPILRQLDAEKSKSSNIKRESYLDNESKFRFDLNENTMAVHQLSEGIRKFAADAMALKDIVRQRLIAKDHLDTTHISM